MSSKRQIRNLPGFFVLGAQKSGTTTLHNWLVQQPDVCLPRIKETHFFSDKERYQRGIDWYLNEFPKCSEGDTKGEIDPEYLFFKNAPIRIRKWIKSPRFVIIFRHPLHRAFSQYQMSVRRGYEDLPFVDALLKEKERLARTDNLFALRHQSYLARGLYCGQLIHYKEIFPDADFLYEKFDDLFDMVNGHAVYARICRFIGLASTPIMAHRNLRSNQASVPKSILLRDLIYGHRARRLKRMLRLLVPSNKNRYRIKMAVDRLNTRPSQGQDELKSVAIPGELIQEINQEILRLEGITHLNLLNWIYSDERIRLSEG